MKRKLTLLVAAIAILFTACTKDEENPVISNSSWTFNGLVHSTVKSSRTAASGNAAGQITFTDSNKGREGTLTVYFKALPQTAGTYTLVQGLGSGLGTNEVAVSATAGTSGSTFAYNETGSVTVQVTITDNGKIKIDIPEVTLNSSAGSENYKLSASVYEVN
ncbi:MAG: hypothetical protein JKY70_13815 [Mucilaginibacter sp.]|nr:hypothetical protein [Mucilaginibacter sp.]